MRLEKVSCICIYYQSRKLFLEKSLQIRNNHEIEFKQTKAIGFFESFS